MSEFKILIVEDEVLIAEVLKDELFALGYFNVFLAHNKTQALFKLSEINPDLVLLDIRMKSEKEGIEIAHEINLKYKIPFIFITAHSDKYILQTAIDTNPVAYITKPFKQIDIYAAIKILEGKSENIKEEYIVFKDNYIDVKLSVNDILYVQSDDNYIHIYTSTKRFMIRNTLSWFKENTPSSLFHQTHRSFIVNISKVTKSNSKFVWINSIQIPVSRGNNVNL